MRRSFAGLYIIAINQRPGLKTGTILQMLGYLLIVAEVAVIVGMGLAYYTVIQSAASTLGSDGGSPLAFNGNMDPSTGAFNGTLSVALKNAGMLDMAVSVDVKMLSEQGSQLYETSGQKRLAPGSLGTIEMPVNLSGPIGQQVHTVILGLKITTLFDLISFSVDVPIPAGIGGGGE
jgi:hypothetical protein